MDYENESSISRKRKHTGADPSSNCDHTPTEKEGESVQNDNGQSANGGKHKERPEKRRKHSQRVRDLGRSEDGSRDSSLGTSTEHITPTNPSKQRRRRAKDPGNREKKEGDAPDDAASAHADTSSDTRKSGHSNEPQGKQPESVDEGAATDADRTTDAGKSNSRRRKHRKKHTKHKREKYTKDKKEKQNTKRREANLTPKEFEKQIVNGDVYPEVGDALVLDARSQSQETTWTSSASIGGRFLDKPVAFSSDEKYIQYATEGAVSIASIDTSLTERSLQNIWGGVITFVIRSYRHKSSIYVSTSGGGLVLWSWKKHDQQAQQIAAASPKGTAIVAIAAAEFHNQAPEVVFAAEKTGSSSFVRAYIIDFSSRKSVQLLQVKHQIHSVKVHRSGRIILATTPNSLFVGYLAKRVLPSSLVESMDELQYTWQEIKCKEPPTCFDFRFSRDPALKINNQDVILPVTARDRFDVAYGGLKGCIYLHTNLVSDLTTPAMNNRSHKHALPQELHWHRESVGAVAFSADGNYLISGGQETVLVIWQLDTGNKTFLPHLESPIRTLSVSPSGVLYAVGLADNSIMVLSTAEVKPIAHVASLQSPNSPSLADVRQILPTKEVLSTYLEGQATTSLPCDINPANPGHVLLAAPSYRSTNTTIFAHTSPSPYLQTYDILSDLHVSRQALTRNNATSTNLGPEGNRIHEPNISHVAIAPNGRWMATIDEWAPPADNVRDLVAELSEIEDEIAKQREVNLRIWHWNDKEKDWMLNTALPSPHETRRSGPGAARVHTLISSPVDNCFASFGEDGAVRLWTPKTRGADGKIIRGEGLAAHAKSAKKTQTWWTLRESIPLEGRMQDEPLTALTPNSAKVSWSDDGSLIAVCVGYPEIDQALRRAITAEEDDIDLDDIDTTPTPSPRDTVHLIDADAAIVCDRLTNILTKPARPSISQNTIAALAFANRYLLILSRITITIWDLPFAKLLLTLPIANPTPDAPAPHLAVNPQTHTFAIATAVRSPHKHPHDKDLPPHPHRDFASLIHVYPLPTSHNKDMKPLLHQPLPHLTLALRSAGGAAAYDDHASDPHHSLKRGYVVIDSNASAWRMNPPVMSGALAKALETDGETNSAELEGSEEEDLVAPVAPTPGSMDSDDEEGGDAEEGLRPPTQPRVVASEKLAEAVGEGDAGGGLPSVRVMYERVMGLFWGK